MALALYLGVDTLGWSGSVVQPDLVGFVVWAYSRGMEAYLGLGEILEPVSVEVL